MSNLIPTLCSMIESLAGRKQQHICTKTLVTATEVSEEDETCQNVSAYV
jgi:hypothetical protein